MSDQGDDKRFFRIVSDGRGTTVTDMVLGDQIKFLSKVTIEIGPPDFLARAKIETFLTKIDVKCRGEVIVICPACRKEIDDLTSLKKGVAEK